MRVTWESNDVSYTAILLFDVASIKKVMLELLTGGLRPTKIIASAESMVKIWNIFADQTSDDGSIFAYPGIAPVTTQVDHRVVDTAYILYEKMEQSAVEAPEFAGLDELP